MSVSIKSAREIELMRAAGKILAKVHENLQKEFGKGFSEDTLKNARKFYLTYKYI